MQRKCKSSELFFHHFGDLGGVFLALSKGSLKLCLLLFPFPFPFPFAFAFPLIFRGSGSSSSSLCSARSVRPKPVFSSSSYARMRPSLSPDLPYPALPMLILWGSKLLRACILLLVCIPDNISVGMPSREAPFIILWPSESPREILRRYTPVKITKNPLRRDIVLTASTVLKPP